MTSQTSGNGARVHGFAPVCDARSRMLLLGTFPSPLSRERAMYYGHPRNSFWRLICDSLDAPLPGDAEQSRALLLGHGIALWDVVASCVIEGAADSAIREPIANDIPALLRAHPGIARVCFTSANAGKLYARLIGPVGPDWRALPSSSPAYVAMTYARKLDVWKNALTNG